MRKFRGRQNGATSMRKALKSASDAGIKIEIKQGSSLVKLTAKNGDTITISSRDREVTRKTAAWLRSHGALQSK